ncbi:hypothetical protein XELAEV_18037259mg [Xenopus laevis]|uniref:Uncharacterized protein n=1 Tax=Xenopus laevis TaxID=8355 RepID=A0A974CBU6_XENLA|nr:hypothetical protein XELAEV_18037259mg [Xenopus laevis]
MALTMAGIPLSKITQSGRGTHAAVMVLRSKARYITISRLPMKPQGHLCVSSSGSRSNTIAIPSTHQIRYRRSICGNPDFFTSVVPGG